MNLSLEKKNALISGSTSGIGLAIAQELAHLGASCILLARNEEKLRNAIASLDRSSGQEHRYLVADFSQPETVEKVVQDFVSSHPVHILINNTGGPPGGPILNAPVEEFLNAIRAHLVCNHLITQAVVPGMKEAVFGRIVNIISTSVKIPLKGLGVSNTTRGAVASWSKTMANELAPLGITVNNVLPGATMTGRLESIIQNKARKTDTGTAEIEKEMQEEIPMQRFGKPEEIAAMAAFLCTPAASYVTGVSIQVDGGRTGTI